MSAPCLNEKGFSHSGYLFVHAKEDCDPFALFKEFASEENVLSCEGVRGDFEIILHIQGASPQDLHACAQGLIAKQGVGSALFSPVEKQDLRCGSPGGIAGGDHSHHAQETPAEHLCRSYAVIEAKPSEFEELSKSMRSMKCVAWGKGLSGLSRMLLKIEAPRFDHMEDLIVKRISPLDGVERVYHLPIMEFTRDSAPADFHLALWKYRGEKDLLIPLLQAAQDHYSYVPESAIYTISSVTAIPVSEIYGVVTFYRQFRLKPPGRHIIRACDGTACHVNSSTMIIDTLKSLLSIEPDETTDDRLFTLQTVACLGCCSLAPVMMIDDETYGRLNPSKIDSIIATYRS